MSWLLYDRYLRALLTASTDDRASAHLIRWHIYKPTGQKCYKPSFEGVVFKKIILKFLARQSQVSENFWVRLDLY